MTWPTPIAELEPTVVFESLWSFIAARYSIYLCRLREESPPWTFDPILNQYKFTNVFRACDRVSQEGIRISLDPISATSLEEQFFRIVLFKFFNKIETWQALTAALGEEPRLANFDLDRYDYILEGLKRKSVKIYSAAYMMPCPADYAVEGVVRKHSMHLHMLWDMLAAEIPAQLEVGSLAKAYAVLRKVRMLGNFLAYQLIIDINYGPHLGYQENEFVVPGPGAEEGIKKCFRNPGKRSEADIIKLVTEYQDICASIVTGEPAPRLFGQRPLQLIDIQNCFCEIAKYSRVAFPEFNTSRTRIKHLYAPSWFRPLPKPVFPAQWGIDTACEEFLAALSK
jgi:hypothetical protein